MDHTYLTNLIGSGAQADVYLYDNRAVKVFKENYSEADAVYEANIQSCVYRAGLPVPKIYEVVTIENRKAIIMEYIKGNALGELLLGDVMHAIEYLDLAVELQQKVHRIKNAEGLPLLKDKLKSKIMRTSLINEDIKQKCLQYLGQLEVDNTLCHGDLHVLNLIKTENDIKIIDWVDASLGSAAADVCRSYLLYLLYKNEIAEYYLQSYCNKSDISKDMVLSWLPVLAAARLVENNSPDDIKILLDIINKEF